MPDGYSKPVVNMFVSAEEMTNAIQSAEGAPLVIGEHAWCTPEVIKEYQIGQVAGTPKVEDGYMVCDLLITDPQAIEDIESKKFSEISAAYLADAVFEDGEGFDAKQTNLHFNHIAIIPAGHGRAGQDVRILNKQKGAQQMADEKKLVRVQLANTGKYVNVDEETADAISENDTAAEESKAKSLEDTMGTLESKNDEMAALQAEIEELKGELSVYKEKLEQLLSEETIEHAAAELVEEASEAGDIVENAVCDEKKEEVMNSIKGLYGTKLQTAVLTAIGVKCENMSNDAIRGAFKAQHQIVKAGVYKNTKKVAGQEMVQNSTSGQTFTRSALQRLGFSK